MSEETTSNPAHREPTMWFEKEHKGRREVTVELPEALSNDACARVIKAVCDEIGSRGLRYEAKLLPADANLKRHMSVWYTIRPAERLSRDRILVYLEANRLSANQRAALLREEGEWDFTVKLPGSGTAGTKDQYPFQQAVLEETETEGWPVFLHRRLSAAVDEELSKLPA